VDGQRTRHDGALRHRAPVAAVPHRRPGHTLAKTVLAHVAVAEVQAVRTGEAVIVHGLRNRYTLGLRHSDDGRRDQRVGIVQVHHVGAERPDPRFERLGVLQRVDRPHRQFHPLDGPEVLDLVTVPDVGVDRNTSVAKQGDLLVDDHVLARWERGAVAVVHHQHPHSGTSLPGRSWVSSSNITSPHA
jgi:hypothetical protein